MESGMGKGFESWMPVTPVKPVGSVGLNAGIEFTAANPPNFGEYENMSFTALVGSSPGIVDVESCSSFQTNPISGIDVPATPPVPQYHIEDADCTNKRRNIDIDLNKRPRKRHKVKRHRPKVLTEGKPSKPPKLRPFAPKPDMSRPSTPRCSTPKPRKYVRKKDSRNDDLKGLGSSRTSRFIDEKATYMSPECASIKTCKRALNFSVQEVDANPISHNVVEQSSQAVNFDCSFRNTATPKGSMHKWKKLTSFICKKRRMPRQKRTMFNIVSSIIAEETSVSRLKRAYNKQKPVGEKSLASQLDDKRVEKAIRKCNLSILGCNFEKVKEFHQLVLPTLNQIQEAVADPETFKCVLSLRPFLRSKRKRSKGLTRGRGSRIKAFEFEKCPLSSAGLVDDGNCYSQNRDVHGKLPLLLQKNESVDFEKCTPSQKVVLVRNECKQLVVLDAHSNRELVKYDPPKKQKHRAEVVFDDGTLIIWNQLMGIKGSDHLRIMDKDTEQKWNEDKELFRGKVDAFLALMHSIQGDRKFIPWNGSVVDSVVGVYLTQNVTDTLSSNAFMSLAAKFPVKPRKKDTYDVEVVCSQESTEGNDINVVVEEDVCHVSETAENMKTQCGDVVDETLSKCGFTISDASPFEDTKKERSTSVREALDMEEINFLKQFCCDEDENLVSTKGERGNQSSQDFRTKVSTATFDLNVSSQDVVGFRGNMEMEIKDNCDRNGMNECQNHSGCGSGETIHHNNAGPKGQEAQAADPKSSGKSSQDFRTKVSTATFDLNVSSQDVLGFRGNMEMEIKDNCDRNGMNECQNHSGCGSGETIHHNNAGPKEQEAQAADPKSSGKSLQSQVHSSTSEMEIKDNCDRNGMNECQNYSGCGSGKTIQQNNAGPKGREAQAADPKSLGKILQSQVHSSTKMEINDNCDRNEMNECQNHSGCGSGERIHQNNAGPKEQEAQATDPKSLGKTLQSQVHSSNSERDVIGTASRQRRSKGEKEPEIKIDWEALRKMYCDYETKESEGDTLDSVDWDAVRHATVEEIAATIEKRGMHNILAGRIKGFLDRLVNDHGKIDLEWLRNVPAPEAKKFLLSIPGLGLKSVECIRLLTLHHHAFPVDTNVARVAVRLGWVPVEPLAGVPLHFLNAFPDTDTIQKYLYPRLYNVALPIVYELHCQMIAFGKVFCTKLHPNCTACPMRPECKHYASLSSEKLALPTPKDKRIVTSDIPSVADEHSPIPPAAPLGALYISDSSDPVRNCEPIVEIPQSPEPASREPELMDIEDLFSHPDEEIPTIALNTEKFKENEYSTVDTYEMLKCQEAEMSKALVTLPPEVASIPVRKIKFTSRLKTVHRVYELPDSHPILTKFERRQPGDPCPYLFAMPPTDESSTSPEQPHQGGNSQGSETGSNNEDPHMVAGTILIPCRTATRGRFPLNGTYFQVNEVFADNESSRQPINVPRAWLWNLPVRYVYCGTSVTNILNNRPLGEIMDCFRGFICVRGFDKETRAPKPLHRRFHLSVMQQAKEKQLSKSKRNPPKEA